MRIARIDCFSGAAGDMLVGACLDAGVALDLLRDSVNRLGLGVELAARRVQRQSIAGTRFEVIEREASTTHRHLSDIETIVRGAGFAPEPERTILAVFGELARAEASVHGVDVESIHFHEVGAVDAIVDVVCAVVAIEALEVGRISCSAITVGTGLVTCEHGMMPVPAPGTLALLEGLPIRACELSGERCTPTGAALLRVLADEFAEPVSFVPRRVGYGAGSRDEGPVPNLLRITVGETEDARGSDIVWELSLQVDNASGEVLGHALRRVLEAGALDAWAAPTLTKKNRPAHWVVALCDDARRQQVEDCLLAELPTLGLRRQRIERRTLPRRTEERDTPVGRLRFKVRTLPDGTEIAHPEADDVERRARELGISVPALLARLLGCA